MMEKNITRGIFTKRLLNAALWCALLALMAGCATSKKAEGPVFFPPPPDPPRVQFLTALNSSEDLVVKKKSFFGWLFGQEDDEGPVNIGKPYGVTVYKGKIYVCDLGGKIIIIDPEKREFDYMGKGKNLKGLKKPATIAIDAAGIMYIIDVERKEVLVYTPNGDFVRSMGKGTLGKPSGIILDEGNVYVLDFGNNAIFVFDQKNGELVRTMDQTMEGGKAIQAPTNFALDSHGVFYITNIVGSNVVMFDRDGHYLGAFGTLGDTFGEFARPKGVAIDHEGRVYVVDNGMQQVNIFTESGKKLLLPFGAPGLPKGSLNLPISIVVTNEMIPYFRQFADPGFILEDLIIVTNQYGNSKLSVYGLGHKEEAPAGQNKAGETPKPASAGETVK
jgi:sugar lactone lactonase YvrE